jgi:2,3-dihydro-2,3-dihydroxybenzoate dehydrogenase
MQTDFVGKRVWVTGAGRGIGRAIADGFTRDGAEVVGLDVAFPDRPGFQTEQLDVADAHAVEEVSAALLKENNRIDIFVHAAGVLRVGRIGQLASEDWRACIDVNAGGAFNLLRVLAPVFMRQRSGSIVAVSSNASHVPRVGMAAYGASKTALTNLMQSVGLELAPYGVRCNIVSPGSTDTDMLRGMWDGDTNGATNTIAGAPAAFRLGIPLGKLANVDDIANAVLFMASELAGQITLHDLVVDGGATLGA